MFMGVALDAALVAEARNEDERAVGWLKVAPAATMSKLYGRRVYRTLSCFEGDRASVGVIGHVDQRVDETQVREGLGPAQLATSVPT